MSAQHLRLLLVRATPHPHESLAAALRDSCGYSVTLTSSYADALADDALSARYDAVVIDAAAPPRSNGRRARPALALLAEIRQRHPAVPCIVLSGRGPRGRVAALRAGATYALSHPVAPEELAVAAARAVEDRRRQDSARVDEHRSVAKFAAIHQVATAISSLRDRDEILAATCRAAAELFDVDHSGLVLFEPDGSCGRVVAEYPAIGTRDLVIPITGIPAEEQLVARGEAIILSDSGSEQGLKQVTQVFRRFDIRSILIVPVIFQGRVLGSFSLDAIGRTHEFSAEEIDLCRIFAAQVAVAIEHAKLFADVRRRVDQLETVRQTTLAITSELDRDAVLRTIIQQAVSLLGASSGGIYEYHPERGVLVIVADYGRLDKLRGSELRAGEGMAGRLIVTGEPFLIVDDYNRWPGRAPIYQGERPFGAVIEIALTWKDQIVGVLYVDDRVGRVFTDDDAHLLQLFADHAAIALMNANLAAQEVSKRQRLEQLADANSAIVDNLGVLSLDDRLGLIAQHAAQILRAESCGIFLVKRPGYLSLEASYGHRAGAFEKGRELEIVVGPRLGLTGNIAASGALFNAYGEELARNSAARSDARHHTPSGAGYSLLAIPLKRRRESEEELIGLLRVDNKKDSTGRATPQIGFSQEDAWILSLFVHAVVVAIEDARLVAELKERTDYLDRLVASLPNGVIAIDRAGRITRFNQQAAAMMGYREAEVLGQPVDMLYGNAHEPRRIGRLLHGAPDRPISHETTIRGRAGEHIPIRLSATWIYSARGERIGSVGYFEDLRSIKESERRLALLLEASNIVARAENLIGALHSLADMMVRLLDTSFCRIFLLDEHHRFLVTQAAAVGTYPEQISWSPGLGERTAVADWPRLEHFLEVGRPRVLRASGRGSQSLLAEWARRLALRRPIQAMLVIPLRAADHIVGLIDLGELYLGEAAFTPEKIDFAAAVAAQTAIMIDRMRLAQIGEQREQLLVNLDRATRHMRALKGLDILQQEISRLAAELLGGQAGGLCLCRPQLQELELVAAYGIEPAPLGALQPYAEGLLGLVAHSGMVVPAHDYLGSPDRDPLLIAAGLSTVVAAPLRQVGEVTAVLFVGGRRGTYQFGESSLEVLERFAGHAALVLQSARLITREQRVVSQLTILHKISDYIQAASSLDNILLAVLTGITASYGLRFNRAAVLLLDRRHQELAGQMGIGHIDEQAAWQDWQRHEEQGLDDFGRFLDLLEAGVLDMTPIGERVRALRLPLDDAGDDVFTRAIAAAHWQLVSSDDLVALPFSFIEAFRPALPLLIAPLIARGHVVGLLVVDNKFTRAPITHETIETLLTFANTAAIAIDNIRLRQEAESIGVQLRTFYEASNALVSEQEPGQVLQEIVERACRASHADGVSMVLIDERAHVRRMMTAGADRQIDLSRLMRPNGISMLVLRTGVPEIIEDTYAQRSRANPSLLERGIATALCMPVLLEGRGIGVMWFHYARKRSFTAAEIKAVQLYVNQAAVAYDNARRIRELSKAHETALVVTRMMALDQSQVGTLREIFEGARDLLGCDAVILYAYEHDRQRLRPPIAAGLRAAQPPDAPDEPLALAMLQQDTLYVAEDAALDRLLRDHWFVQEERIASCVAIPLRGGSEPVGVMFVLFGTPHHFIHDELRNIEHFAHQASVAIRNAQLYERLEKHVAALRALYEAGRALTGSLDRDDVLQRIAEQAWRLTTLDGKRVGFAYIRFLDGPRARAVATYPPGRPASGGDSAAPGQRAADGGWGGVVGRTARLAEAQLVVDTGRDPDYLSADPQTRSELAVPIKLDERVIGVINVESPELDAFDTADQRVLELLAAQAAAAIENARLFAEVEQRAAQFKMLYESSLSLTAELSSRSLLQAVVDCARQITGAQYGALGVLDTAGAVQLFITSGVESAAAAPSMSHGLLSTLVSARETIRTPDVHRHERFSGYPADHPAIGSFLGTPIRYQGLVSGNLYVANKRAAPEFSREDAEALELLAAQAAVAIQNARQFEQIKKATERLTAIHQITIAAASKKEVRDQILQTAITEIVRVFDADQGGVVLFDEASGSGYTMAEYPDRREPPFPIPIAGNAAIEWILEHRRPLALDDALDDPLLASVQPLLKRWSIRSLLLAPLIVSGEVVGTIGLDSVERPRRFSGEELSLAQVMANHVALALENAQLHVEIRSRLDELQRTKENLAANATIAWMGMVDATWRHAIVNHALAIRNNVSTLQKMLPEQTLLGTPQEILLEIQRVAEMIRDRPITPPLSREEGAVSVPINDFLRERLRQIQENERYSSVAFAFTAAMDESVTVRISREWIRNVFDILIGNAIEAMSQSEQRCVTITTRLVGRQVEIAVIDTGRGMSSRIRDQLGREKIAKHQGDRGMGMGVLLAQTIIQTYGGKIEVGTTSPAGTTIIVHLPVEQHKQLGS